MIAKGPELVIGAHLDKRGILILGLWFTNDHFKPCATCPATDATIHLLEGARHEVLNKTNREDIIGLVAD